jgi:N-acetyl-gamma-glutamyl-phosphate reductase
MDRGILSTIYAKASKTLATADVLETLASFYKGEPFVRVLPEGVFPKTKDVRGTNVCEIGGVSDPRTGRIVLIAAIDNLMKGASSQAVQNMNLMCGFDEKSGLSQQSLAP